MRFASTRSGLVLALCAASASADDLAPPVQLKAGDAPIDVDVGHAAPFLWDMDGDGYVYPFLRRAPATEGARVF